MFDVTFFRENLVTVVHPAGLKIKRKILDDPNATFVWGELMDPRFIGKLLGSPRPYAPATVSGMKRKPTKDFFAAVPAPSGVMQGVVLFGLSKTDLRKLDEFEQAGVVMERRVIVAVIGQMKRKTFIYTKRNKR